MKTKAFRHGDLVLLPIKVLPKGLVKADTNVLMTGSGGNDHTVKNCVVYFKKEDDFIFGYLVARKGARLCHKDHSPNGTILPIGNYQLRKQQEFTNGRMRPVID